MIDLQQVRERPILFSAPMVRALLDGTKTQTRRVVKNPDAVLHRVAKWLYSDQTELTLCHHMWPGKRVQSQCRDCYLEMAAKCPYGVPGDRLWVRETFALECQEDGNEPPHKDGRPLKMSSDGERWTQPHYRATDEAPQLVCYEDRCRACSTDHGDGEGGPHWTPSIHMPRWASRLTLEIVSVRVERLQDISREDAIAEGIGPWDHLGWPNYLNPERRTSSPVQTYETLWESINGPGSWAANPWVWAVEFKVVPVRPRSEGEG